MKPFSLTVCSLCLIALPFSSVADEPIVTTTVEVEELNDDDASMELNSDLLDAQILENEQPSIQMEDVDVRFGIFPNYPRHDRRWHRYPYNGYRRWAPGISFRFGYATCFARNSNGQVYRAKGWGAAHSIQRKAVKKCQLNSRRAYSCRAVGCR